MDSPVLLIALIVFLLIGVPALVITRAATKSRRELASAAAPETTTTAAAPTSLGDKLSSSRSMFGTRMRSLLTRTDLDDAFWAGLTEALIAADVGVVAATEITDRVQADGPSDAAEAYDALRHELVAAFRADDRHLPPLGDGPIVMVIVGVNGSGKTTSIAKLAQRYDSLGARVVLGAADTFRAGAAEQLRVWGRKLGIDVVSGEPESDPASVAHDAISAATATSADVVIIDTAGRLHSDANLMEELAKLVRIVEREASGDPEILLVLDGTGGQNSIAQAKTFTQAVGVTGIVVTKLDGTAKGGMTVAVEGELGVPIKLIGVGESPDDLVAFDPHQFVYALVEERHE